MGASIELESLPGRLVVEHGSVRAGTIKIYSIMRNERFFLEAFFDHYRALGVEQFLILDDGSADGSVEFLRAQQDCVLLSSDLAFGTNIAVKMPDGRIRHDRAGVFFKRVIGETFCQGEFGLYVDADEFLLLPRAVGDLPSLYRRLTERGIDAVVASLVEFYPDSVRDLAGSPRPRTFADLTALYPYFDAVPLVKFRAGLAPKRVNRSASSRLFANYGITLPADPLPLAPRWLNRLVLNRLMPRRPGKSATMKTPIVRWRPGVWLVDAHRSNVRPSDAVLLAFAHFKFTHRLAHKTEEAIRLRSYAGKSEKYELYADLMTRMLASGARFAGPDSSRYSGPADLEVAGLLEWRLD